MELSLRPNPLSGIARYSPRWRPAMRAENPCTGWERNGKVTPLTVPGPGTTKLPAGGPSANVSNGRTARPTRVGSGVAEVAEPAAPVVAAAVAAKAGSIRIVAMGARRRCHLD